MLAFAWQDKRITMSLRIKGNEDVEKYKSKIRRNVSKYHDTHSHK
jgi:hypothetical protein